MGGEGACQTASETINLKNIILMKKKTYVAPKLDLFRMTGTRQNLLVTFSMSGNIEDYEGVEEEDF